MCEDDEKRAEGMKAPVVQDLLVLAETQQPDLLPRLMERWGNGTLSISPETSLMLHPDKCNNCGHCSEAWVMCDKCERRQYCSSRCKEDCRERHRAVCSWPHGRSLDDWPYGIEGPWRTKMAQSPQYEYISAHQSSCRNSGVPDLPAIRFRNIINGCLGRRWLVTALIVACISLERYECDNEPCRERKRWLDEKAPGCSWSPFRELVLTCLSCQVQSPAKSLDLLNDCAPYHWEDSKEVNRLPRFPCIDIHGAVDLLRWASLASHTSGQSGMWDDRQRPLGYDLKPEPFLQACRDIDLCPSRLWNIALQSHGTIDMRPLIHTIRGFPRLKRKKHVNCTEQICLLSHENSSLVQQAHKCNSHNCGKETQFSAETLNQAYGKVDPHTWTQTAWSVRHVQALCNPEDSYVALSHVWSDGTGTGIKGPGRLNECLYQFFADTVIQLGCSGLWWDTISLPTEREPRKAALNVMLDNYERAKYTIVHDSDLAEFKWEDDGSPALALVLSAWFTRGWTAAELYASRNHPVKVLFKNPCAPGVVLKDLDEDILVWEPDGNITDHLPERFSKMYSWAKNTPAMNSVILPRLGHLIASRILRKLRPLKFPVGHQGQPSLGQIARIMKSRTTSWARDGLIIAGLLCLPLFAFDSSASSVEITQQLLKSSIHINRYDLLHGEIPIANHGPWSWCPPSIYDFGKAHSAYSEEPEVSAGDCLVNDKGILFCRDFFATSLHENDVLFPFSTHPALVKNINVARLSHWKCVLLAPSRDDHEWILAVPIKLEPRERHGTMKNCLSCRWIGCVRGEIFLRSPNRTCIVPEVNFTNASELTPDRLDELFRDDMEPMYGRKIDKIDVEFGNDLDGSGLELEPQYLMPLLQKLQMEPKWKLPKVDRDALMQQMLQQEARRAALAASLAEDK